LHQTNFLNNVVLEGKGKGKLQEVDFEAAFAQAAASLSSAATGTTQDDLVGITKTLDNTSLHTTDAETEDDIEFRQSASFNLRSQKIADTCTRCSVWDQLQNSDVPPPKEDMSKWESEFNQLMSAQRDELDHGYGVAMQQAWETGLGNFSGAVPGDMGLKFNSEGIPILDDYTFGTTFTIFLFFGDLTDTVSERNNKYLEPTNPRSFLSDAKALLDQNGSLSEAALLLEAAIQKGDLGNGGYEAWVLLGETRNMDEREELGMKALTEGVKRAEEAGAPGVGMLVNNFITHSSKTPLTRSLEVSGNILHQ